MKKKAIFIVSRNKNFKEIKNNLVLFAGKYCLSEKLEKKLKTKKIKYEFLKNIYNDKKKNLKEFNFCNAVYIKILKELSIQLNKVHNINWTERSWEIFIGPWLNRYVAVINNRLNLLEAANKKYEIVFQKKNKKQILLFSDIFDFTNKSVNDKWNNDFIQRLNDIKKTKNLNYEYLKYFKFKDIEKSETFSQKIFFYLKNISNFFFCIFYYFNLNKCVFNRVYFNSTKTVLKLFFKLKEIPTKFYFSEINFKKNFNLKKRENIKINYEVKNYKEKIIRFLLKEMIPTIYLEGFSKLKQTLKSHNVPRNKILIFTRNLWRDDIFKFWIANQVNNRSKLVCGQHGAGYGMFEGTFGDFFETRISNIFFTWGQKEKLSPKIKRGTIPSAIQIIKNKNKKRNLLKTNKILFVGGVKNVFLFRNALFNDNDYSNYIYDFAKNLNTKLYKNLIFKPHPMEHRKNISYTKLISLAFNNKIKILKKKDDLENLILNSKISIFNYLGTEFLKNLALNVPSIYIMPEDEKKFLNKYALRYFKILENSSIIICDGKIAAKFINQNYLEINKWWLSKKTQKSIKIFIKEFANTDQNIYENFENILLNMKKNI